jgi:RsiW-degrading membrane proteinase PrsW (M82 family)
MNLLLIAVAPVLVILIYVYIHDRYEKEPPSLLIGSFLLGAVLSVILVFIIYYYHWKCHWCH